MHVSFNVKNCNSSTENLALQELKNKSASHNHHHLRRKTSVDVLSLDTFSLSDSDGRDFYNNCKTGGWARHFFV